MALLIKENIAQFYSADDLRSAILVNDPSLLDYKRMSLRDLNAIYFLDYDFTDRFIKHVSALLTKADVDNAPNRKLYILILLYTKNTFVLQDVKKSYVDKVFQTLYMSSPVMFLTQSYRQLLSPAAFESLFKKDVFDLDEAIKMSIKVCIAYDESLPMIARHYGVYLNCGLRVRVYAGLILYAVNQTIIHRQLNYPLVNDDPNCDIEQFYSIIPDDDYTQPMLMNYINYARSIRLIPPVEYFNEFTHTLQKPYVRAIFKF